MYSQVWTGTTVPTATTDNVSIGTSISDSKLNIESGYGILNCTYMGAPALKIQWNYPSAQALCPSGISGIKPDIINIYAPPSFPGGSNSPILRLTENQYSLFGNPVTHYNTSLHGRTLLNGPVHLNHKVRINSNSLLATDFSTSFPFSFSVDNGDARFLGKVQIGNLKPTNSFANYALGVDGDIVCKKMIVQITDWADFVFIKNYKLKPLAEVEKYILANKHLPAMPSEKEIKDNGLDTGEMLKLQQQKIEELTLYLIQQQKQIDELSSQLKK